MGSWNIPILGGLIFLLAACIYELAKGDDDD
jgi:hypothetical protein